MEQAKAPKENEVPTRNPEDPGMESTLEETFHALDEIIAKLQQPETNLEEALAIYQKGTSLLKACSRKIDLAEKQVQLLGEEGELHDL